MASFLPKPLLLLNQYLVLTWELRPDLWGHGNIKIVDMCANTHARVCEATTIGEVRALQKTKKSPFQGPPFLQASHPSFL